MVVNNTVQLLMEIGFSEYEARAYTALARRHPATAYETARESGIPTSKIYEVLIKLADRGVISTVESGSKKQYVPLSPEEFIESGKGRFDAVFNRLGEDLVSLTRERNASIIWNIGSYDYLMEKTLRMVKGARKEVLLSCWREEFSVIRKEITRARKSGLRSAVVHFGAPGKDTDGLYIHPIEDTIYAEKGGRGLVIVADSKEALIGTVGDGNTVEGAWSMNRGFVTLAEDYIKHDVYIMKIVKRFEAGLKKRFGAKYEKLRDVFTDREAI